MSITELLLKYRRILDCIHIQGNIYYDEGRFKGYLLIAKVASDLRYKGE